MCREDFHKGTDQTLFYLCVVTGAHIVYSRSGGSKEVLCGLNPCDYTQVEKSLASETKLLPFFVNALSLRYYFRLLMKKCIVLLTPTCVR